VLIVTPTIPPTDNTELICLAVDGVIFSVCERV